ncbi:MAG TPA: ATP-binding protein [Vicinamibacterales bacterium]|nr:ATP-binding protein [Vicinamibacterales bacterium]
MRQLSRAVLALGSVAAVTWLYAHVIHISNGSIVALTFLLIVLLVAATSTLWIAVATALAATIAFNFFFLPPVGALTIEDPQNWVALFTFLAVSLIASNLSSAVRARERVAIERRDEVARLFDLSRDVLLITDSDEAISGLAAVVGRRFDLDYVAVCLPKGADWDVFESGTTERSLDRSELTTAFMASAPVHELDPASRGHAHHRSTQAGGTTVKLVLLRVGAKPVGLLATAGRPVEGGTLDALGGVVAIAIERAHLLEARKAADLARQSEELKSALLASLGHDLRTPLTAIRVAASNLQASWLTPEDRIGQSDIVLIEVERLTRLFQNILDMARIDAGAVSAEERWVHPAEIVGAARDLVPQALREHPVQVSIDADVLVRVDPRLTAAALSHLLENAAQYSAPGTPIEIGANIEDAQVTLTVRDHGPGIPTADLPHLFERFYRGGNGKKKRIAGTGMGLSIARGLVAAEHGRIWAENRRDGGAAFTIALAAESKHADARLADADA